MGSISYYIIPLVINSLGVETMHIYSTCISTSYTPTGSIWHNKTLKISKLNNKLLKCLFNLLHRISEGLTGYKSQKVIFITFTSPVEMILW